MSSKFKKGDKIMINNSVRGVVLKTTEACGSTLVEYKDENGFAEYAYEFQCELCD